MTARATEISPGADHDETVSDRRSAVATGPPPPAPGGIPTPRDGKTTGRGEISIVSPGSSIDHAVSSMGHAVSSIGHAVSSIGRGATSMVRGAGSIDHDGCSIGHAASLTENSLQASNGLNGTSTAHAVSSNGPPSGAAAPIEEALRVIVRATTGIGRALIGIVPAQTQTVPVSKASVRVSPGRVPVATGNRVAIGAAFADQSGARQGDRPTTLP